MRIILVPLVFKHTSISSILLIQDIDNEHLTNNNSLVGKTKKIKLTYLNNQTLQHRSTA